MVDKEFASSVFERRNVTVERGNVERIEIDTFLPVRFSESFNIKVRIIVDDESEPILYDGGKKYVQHSESTLSILKTELTVLNPATSPVNAIANGSAISEPGTSRD
jgi:hypothetical protein